MSIRVGRQSGCTAVCRAGSGSSQCMGSSWHRRSPTRHRRSHWRIRQICCILQSWQEQLAEHGAFIAQELANAAWALALADQADAPQFAELAGASRRYERVHGTGARQLVIGIRVCAPGRVAAVCNAGEERLAALGRIHFKGARQHGMGNCVG